jgi:UDP-N-acetylglucosamine 1-carboxyvinyltransferase
MDKFIVEGPTPLSGTIPVNGAKNAVLPLMAAALLARGTSVISNVPDLRDTWTMIKMLDILGAKTSLDGDVLTIDTTDANGIEAPYDLVRTMRASIYVLGPTLALHGRARVSMPGGCAWGPRPIDLHLMAMEKLGATITLEHGYIEASCDRLRGGEVTFPISSVGATAQTIMAAALAEGTTVIENAALEPEITDLIHALQECGVEIEGADTARVVIHGTTSVYARARFAPPRPATSPDADVPARERAHPPRQGRLLPPTAGTAPISATTTSGPIRAPWRRAPGARRRLQ